MRILQVGKYYHPSQGGMETVLKNLAEGLAQAGDEVTVICSAESATRSEETINGVRVIREPRYGSPFSQPITPRLAFDLAKLARGHDIVHLHSPNPLASVSALSLPRGTKLVDTYHSDVIRQRLILPFYSPLLHAYLRRCDAVVAATEKHVAHSPFLSKHAGKCRIVPFGLNAAEFEPTPDRARAAEKLRAKHGRFALFVGRLVGYKGVAHLVEAIQDCDACAVIVGNGPELESLRAQARALGVADRVAFETDVRDRELLVAHYLACELFVLPSVTRAEAFGMVLLEAMACGKPLVSTRLDSGVALVNEDGVTGIQVEPGDARELARAMCRILGDSALAARMSHAARARFGERYSVEAMVRGYREIYRELLSDKTRA